MLNVDSRRISNLEDFVCTLSKMIHVLGVSDIEEWMVNVDVYPGAGQQPFDMISLNTAVKDLCASSPFCTERTGTHPFGFCIGNSLKMNRIWHRSGIILTLWHVVLWYDIIRSEMRGIESVRWNVLIGYNLWHQMAWWLGNGLLWLP